MGGGGGELEWGGSGRRGREGGGNLKLVLVVG